MKEYLISVCRGPTCGDKRNSEAIAEEFSRLIDLRNLRGVRMDWQSCYGRCSKGPNVVVQEEVAEQADLAPAEDPLGKFIAGMSSLRARGRATLYNHVTLPDVLDIIVQHIEGGQPLERLAEQSAGGEMSIKT